MNSLSARFVGLAAVATLAFSTAVTSMASAQEVTTPITGTWRVKVTTYNCSTLVENAPFLSYVTFGAEGTLVETTNNPVFQPGQRSSGHGFWERTGRQYYRAVSEAFIQFPSSAPPLARGSQRIDQGIYLVTRNRFASDASITFFDATGAVLLTGCARAKGERLQ